MAALDKAVGSGLEATLRQALVALDLLLSDAQIEQLLAYQALILKWTQTYNLTAVRDPMEMLTHHLLDSLVVLHPLDRQLAAMQAHRPAQQESWRLLDVGSGAGLPGVVIAICRPHIQVHCVDTVAKKAAFIQQVAATLRLPQLRSIHARVESLRETYDVVVSRAFASLADFTAWSQQAVAEGGVWMAMKGKPVPEEVAALPPQVHVFHVEPLSVPHLDAQRCIVWLRRGGENSRKSEVAMKAVGATL